MILPDINALVYAYDATSRHHASAKTWWEGLMNNPQMVGLAWVVLLGFIRITTNPRIFQTPYSPDQTLTIIESWLEQPHVRIIQPSDGHFVLLSGLLREASTAGNLTTDAHLAALAIERGLVLHTTDADFARFPGLKWKKPF